MDMICGATAITHLQAGPMQDCSNMPAADPRIESSHSTSHASYDRKHRRAESKPRVTAAGARCEGLDKEVTALSARTNLLHLAIRGLESIAFSISLSRHFRQVPALRGPLYFETAKHDCHC